MIDLKERLDYLYPIFEQNVRTWTTSKWYRQVPLRYLEELKNFLNAEYGSNKFTCASCNIGGMLDRLNMIYLRNLEVEKPKVIKEKKVKKVEKTKVIKVDEVDENELEIFKEDM